MYFRTALFVGSLALSHGSLAQTNPPILVRVDPAAIEVQAGELFTANLIADLGPHKVIGWGLDLAYGNSVLTQVGKPVIGPLWMASFAPDGDGLTGFSRAGSTGGEGVLLARLTFRADTPGQTQLLPSYTPVDLNEGFPLDPIGFATIAFQPAAVNVVPEPGGMSLMAVLIGLFLRPRRRQHPM